MVHNHQEGNVRKLLAADMDVDPREFEKPLERLANNPIIELRRLLDRLLLIEEKTPNNKNDDPNPK